MLQVSFAYCFTGIIACRILKEGYFYGPEASNAMRQRLRRTLVQTDYILSKTAIEIYAFIISSKAVFPQ